MKIMIPTAIPIKVNPCVLADNSINCVEPCTEIDANNGTPDSSRIAPPINIGELP